MSKIIDNIDAGNSNITAQEGRQIIEVLRNVAEPRISKYQACQLLGISRSRFDQLVREGQIPKGVKQAGFKELSWRKSDILNYYNTNNN